MNVQPESLISIQSCYGKEFSYCFGCGKEHPEGLHLESFLQPDGKAVMHTTPPDRYTGGVPENLYGGFIAMLFDCHGTAAAAAFYLRHVGLPLSSENLQRFITAHLEVDFLKPTPMHNSLEVVAVQIQVTDRKVELALELRIGEEIFAKGKMVAVRFGRKKKDA